MLPVSRSEPLFDLFSSLSGAADHFDAVPEVFKVTQEAGNLSKAYEFFSTEYRLNHLIAMLKKPYVALMDGITSRIDALDPFGSLFLGPDSTGWL